MPDIALIYKFAERTDLLCAGGSLKAQMFFFKSYIDCEELQTTFCQYTPIMQCSHINAIIIITKLNPNYIYTTQFYINFSDNVQLIKLSRCSLWDGNNEMLKERPGIKENIPRGLLYGVNINFPITPSISTYSVNASFIDTC